MTIDKRLKKITDKFYETEEDRQKLIEEHKPFIDHFMEVMGPTINNLYRNNIRFQVFYINFHCDEPTLHAGLSSCCTKRPPKVTQDIRKRVEGKVKLLTHFKKIVWEI